MTAGSLPRHDVVVTNPPFSGTHVQRLLEWCCFGTGAGEGAGEGAVPAPSRKRKRPDPRPFIALLPMFGVPWRALRAISIALPPSSPLRGLTRLLRTCRFVANKPFFHELQATMAAEAQARGWPPPFYYLGPRFHPYAFTAPAGARPTAMATERSDGGHGGPRAA
jgi:hypothetical protein